MFSVVVPPQRRGMTWSSQILGRVAMRSVEAVAQEHVEAGEGGEL